MSVKSEKILLGVTGILDERVMKGILRINIYLKLCYTFNLMF